MFFLCHVYGSMLGPRMIAVYGIQTVPKTSFVHYVFVVMVNTGKIQFL
jgi:hypothetical protein